MKKAAEFKMPAVAITDHGNLFGAIEFYQEAQRAGVKPIIGCEAYIAPGSHKDRPDRGAMRRIISLYWRKTRLVTEIS